MMLSKSSPLLCLETSLNVHILHSLSLLTEIHEASTTRLAPLAYQNLLSYVRIIQVISNLLCNSIKFTNQGTVTISVEEKDTYQIVVSVKDTGIGID